MSLPDPALQKFIRIDNEVFSITKIS